jgi:hypothetical protein
MVMATIFSHHTGGVASRDVTVFICGRLAALNVLFVYQNFNTFLNHADTGIKPSS